ncbi:MAG TPA: DMT family transporter [Candidatus Limnocylindria bacterium]|nr:DMT family transporter [Candidatus Limnocylindria bacterium]
MQNWQNANSTTLPLTLFALVAFAGNSVLCRLALGESVIDPASYTTIRLISGAFTLWLITLLMGRQRSRAGSGGGWLAGGMLFLYAICFSFAYVSLSTGTGALILFAAVQFTMIAAGLRSGERPLPLEWCGLSIAMAGLVYLVFPGIAAPSLAGSLLMAAAGIAWGAYSLLGRRVSNPIQATANNFLRTVPLVLLIALLQLPSLTLSAAGLFWAGLSGAVTSALGYVIWYAALGRLTTTRAATVQLSVPVIAALGGVLFLAEEITGRLLISSAAILGGIGLSVAGRYPPLREGLQRFFAGKFALGRDVDVV